MACVCDSLILISGGRGHIIPTILPYYTIHISALDQKSTIDQNPRRDRNTLHPPQWRRKDVGRMSCRALSHSKLPYYLW